MSRAHFFVFVEEKGVTTYFYEVDASNLHSEDATVDWNEDGNIRSSEVPSGDRTLLTGRVTTAQKPEVVIFSARVTSNNSPLNLNGREQFTLLPSVNNKRVFIMINDKG